MVTNLNLAPSLDQTVRTKVLKAMKDLKFSQFAVNIINRTPEDGGKVIND